MLCLLDEDEDGGVMLSPTFPVVSDTPIIINTDNKIDDVLKEPQVKSRLNSMTRSVASKWKVVVCKDGGVSASDSDWYTV